MEVDVKEGEFEHGHRAEGGVEGSAHFKDLAPVSYPARYRLNACPGWKRMRRVGEDTVVVGRRRRRLRRLLGRDGDGGRRRKGRRWDGVVWDDLRFICWACQGMIVR
jgi:hypothetical protein